ncbi:hypothetical protein SAMN04488522_101568 [Pedobacter caeni]|uniref:Uncharacterized protein n=1 Tax=Pedobacter caeni TaxID=288992 RepID=A0A1M4UHX9_9SPHI|nr:hypothetical protein SAMN04488522_101568 [Pedobacter caeni]
MLFNTKNQSKYNVSPPELVYFPILISLYSKNETFSLIQFHLHYLNCRNVDFFQHEMSKLLNGVSFSSFGPDRFKLMHIKVKLNEKDFKYFGLDHACVCGVDSTNCKN